jgi:hypothetical protein
MLAAFETGHATLTGFRVIIGKRQAVEPMDELRILLADV